MKGGSAVVVLLLILAVEVSTALGQPSVGTSSYGPGVATKLKIGSVPPTLPADGKTYPSIVISLRDALGNPTLAPVNISVGLKSMTVQTGTVSENVTILAGRAYAVANFTTTVGAGSSIIVANATGYKSGQTTVNTQIPSSSPSRITTFVLPADGVSPLSGTEFLVAGQLQDAGGAPADASASTSVLLLSSNASVVPESVMPEIGAGQDLSYSGITGSEVGAVTVNASSTGLVSFGDQLTSVATPLLLTITTSAPTIPANDTAYLTATVLLAGAGIRGANVTWTTSNGTVSPSSSVTNILGQASVLYLPLSPGLANITASIRAPLIGTRSTSAEVMVLSPPETPPQTLLAKYLQLILLVGVIGVVSVGYVLFRRRALRASSGPSA